MQNIYFSDYRFLLETIRILGHSYWGTLSPVNLPLCNTPFENIWDLTSAVQGHAVAQLVEALCATSRKVAVSIPDGVTGIFH
jgi:hypothetical protein